MAAGGVVRELLVLLGVDLDAGTEKKLGSFEDALDNVKERAQDLRDTLAYLAAGAAAVAGALVYQTTETAAYAKQVENQAASLGLTTDAYQELLYAAGKYGVEGGDLADVFGQIAQLASEAANGNQSYADTFAKVGIGIEQLRGAQPEQLFMMLAEGLSQAGDATTRLAVASALLGEDSAKKLGPLLMKGAAGVEELRREAQRLGVVLDEDAIRKSAEFTSSLSELKGRVTSLRNEIGLALMPVVGDLVDDLTVWYDQNREIIQQKIPEYAEDIRSALERMRTALTAVVDKLGGEDGFVGLLERAGAAAALIATGVVVYRVVALGVALAEVAKIAWPFIKGLSTIGGILFDAARLGIGPLSGALGALLAPLSSILLFLAGIVATVLQFAIPLLILEDLYTYATGGASAFGRLFDAVGESNGVVGALVRNVAALVEFFRALYGLISLVGGALFDAFEVVAAPAIEAVSGSLERMLGVLTAVLNALSALAGIGIDAFTEQLNLGTARVQGLTAGAAPLAAAAAPSLASQAAASFAPSMPTVNNPTPYASQSIGGDTITINGVGVTMQEVESLIEQKADQKRRAAAAAFAGRGV